MRINSICITGLVLLFLQLGCANIKLVSSENHQLKFCTNPGNKIAKTSDFDEAAGKQCGGNYRNVSEGLEFFTDPKSKKLGGVLEIQTERHMCRVYECTK
ncbi:MAG: hypothetical protein ACXWRE_08030 [Pseudobdellovibrionaceae bacterium]